MNKFLKIISLLSFGALASLAQIGPGTVIGFQPTSSDPTGRACQSTSVALFIPGGGVYTCHSGVYALTAGAGASNIQTNIAGPATTSGVINITSLGLTAATLNTIIAQCYTGTGFAGGLVTGNLTQLACVITSRSTAAVTVTFASSSNVLVVLNSNGGQGATGATGATGPGYKATSTTSFLIGTGSKVFTTQAGLAYSVGSLARTTSAANSSNWMQGFVTAYSGTSLTINVTETSGAGTLADWNINESGTTGATGAAGSNGTNGSNGAGYAATSTTSVAVGSGNQTFTTQAGLAYVAGVSARATSQGNTSIWMQGNVSSYSGTTLVINVNITSGVGSRADWGISVAPGLDGATGPTGATGATGPGYLASSTTSFTTSTGSKTFTTQAGLAYVTGALVRVVSAGTPGDWMQGQVTSYSGTTLIVSVTEISGSGTHADWNISVAGVTGSSGTGGGISYGVDTSGTPNVLTTSATGFTYTDGSTIQVAVANDSTGAATLNVNGLGNIPITTTTGLAMFTTAFKAGGVYTFIYKGGSFQLVGSGACIQVSTGLSCGIGWITLRGTSSGFRVYNTESVAGNDSIVITGYLPASPPTAGNCVQWANSGGTPGGPVVAQTATGCTQKFLGTSAPGSVTGNLPGDTFTDTTAHNQYVCNAPSGTAAPACTTVAAGGWLLVNGGGAGTVTMQVNGSSAVSGSGSTINVATGSGISASASNAGGVPTVTLAPDTSVLATRNGVQLGADNTCNPSSGSPTAYTCIHSNPITGYSDGMVQSFRPDVNCTAGVITLDVDSKGSRNIYAQDGSTNLTAAQCSTTTQSLMIYGAALNGGVGGWRLLTGGGTSTGGGPVYAVDSGAANSVTVTAAGFTHTAGSSIFIKMNASNTSATTATINGTSINVKTQTIAALPADTLHINGVYLFVDDGTQLEVIGTAACVNTSTGITCTPSGGSSVIMSGSTSGTTTYVPPAVGGNDTRRFLGYSNSVTPTTNNCMFWDVLNGNHLAGDAGFPCRNSMFTANNAQTGTSYTFVNGDCTKQVTFNNASAIAGTLPQAGGGGNFASLCTISVVNQGAGTLTITPTTSTINLALTLVLTTGQGAIITSDGTNYQAMVGKGGGGALTPINGGPMWPMGFISVASVTLAPAANVVWYYQFEVPDPGYVLNTLRVFNVAGTNNIATSIMDSSCTKLAGAAATGAGQTFLGFSYSLTLTPGVYYIGISSDSASQSYYISTMDAAGYGAGMLNAGLGAGTYKVFAGSNVSVTSAGVTTNPTSCGTRTVLGDPAGAISFQVIPGILFQ